MNDPNPPSPIINQPEVPKYGEDGEELSDGSGRFADPVGRIWEPMSFDSLLVDDQLMIEYTTEEDTIYTGDNQTPERGDPIAPEEGDSDGIDVERLLADVLHWLQLLRHRQGNLDSIYRVAPMPIHKKMDSPLIKKLSTTNNNYLFVLNRLNDLLDTFRNVIRVSDHERILEIIREFDLVDADVLFQEGYPTWITAPDDEPQEPQQQEFKNQLELLVGKDAYATRLRIQRFRMHGIGKTRGAWAAFKFIFDKLGSVAVSRHWSVLDGINLQLIYIFRNVTQPSQNPLDMEMLYVYRLALGRVAQGGDITHPGTMNKMIQVLFFRVIPVLHYAKKNIYIKQPMQDPNTLLESYRLVKKRRVNIPWVGPPTKRMNLAWRRYWTGLLQNKFSNMVTAFTNLNTPRIYTLALRNWLNNAIAGPITGPTTAAERKLFKSRLTMLVMYGYIAIMYVDANDTFLNLPGIWVVANRILGIEAVKEYNMSYLLWMMLKYTAFKQGTSVDRIILNELIKLQSLPNVGNAFIRQIQNHFLRFLGDHPTNRYYASKQKFKDVLMNVTESEEEDEEEEEEEDVTNAGTKMVTNLLLPNMIQNMTL